MLYLTFRKEMSEYRPKDYITVDVNENAEAVLIDGLVYLLETGLSKVTLGYHYRRKAFRRDTIRSMALAAGPRGRCSRD